MSQFNLFTSSMSLTFFEIKVLKKNYHLHGNFLIRVFF